MHTRLFVLSHRSPSGKTVALAALPSVADSAPLESVDFPRMAHDAEVVYNTLGNATDDAQIQAVNTALQGLVNEANKALHSLRRRKVACPDAVDAMIEFKCTSLRAFRCVHV